MLFFWIDQLPVRSSKSEDKTSGLARGKAFIDAPSDKIFCREDLEGIIREMLIQIKHLVTNGMPDSITYKDFSKIIFSKDSQIKILEDGVGIDFDQGKDRKSSLYKFLQPDGKSTYSTNYLIELIQSIVDFRHDSSKYKGIDSLQEKHKKFYNHISICLEINNYVYSTGLKTEKEIREALQKNNFILHQLTAYFLINFKDAVKDFGFEELHFSDPETSFLKRDLAETFTNRFFNFENEAYDVSPLIQEFAGAVALKLYSPSQELKDQDKKNISLLLTEAAGLQFNLGENLAKKKKIIQNLFLEIQNVLLSYEKQCDDLRKELLPTFTRRHLDIPLNEKEKIILDRIITTQNAQFEKFIPRWEELIPLPSRNIIIPLIEKQICIDLIEQKKENKKEQEKSKKFDDAIENVFNDIKSKIFSKLDSESKAGIQLIASYLSNSPPKDYDTWNLNKGILSLIVQEASDGIFIWSSRSEGKFFDNLERNQIKTYIQNEVEKLFDANDYKKRLKGASNEPRYSGIWELKDIIPKVLNDLKEKLKILQRNNFILKQ